MTPGPDHAVVIIPAIEVDDLLVRCVEACRRTAPDVPVVVVVDDDAAAHRLDRLARVMASSNPSIGAKRNLAARSTTSRHLAFIDSDAFPASGWIEHATAILDAEPALGAVGGPNVSPPDQTAWEDAVGRAHLSFLVAGWWRYRKMPGARARDVTALPSCNLVVRRSDFEDIGGMNEDLFTAEDTDFCTRLTRRGRRIRFSPDVVVFHKDRGIKGFAIQRYTFGVAMIPLIRRAAMPDPAYVSASVALAAFVLLLASWPIALVSRRWRQIWTATVTGYGLVVLIEALRLSRPSGSVRRTICALLVGNLAPGVGVLTRALRLSPELRGIYRNDR